ncbi:MAG: zinc-binding alcohol dehydrogenase [Thalassobaculales bacterium]
MTPAAFWSIAAGQGAIRPAAAPDPGPGEVRLRALWSAISRGTEALVFTGHIPESEYKRMRSPFQEGEFPFPVKYGYQLVGIVEAGPPERVGELCFCLHPHQTHATVPGEAAVPLPAGLTPARAVLAANMETALNALIDAAPRPGDRIAVVGAGVVGCLVARLAAQIPGTEVELCDIDPAKAAVAAALDLSFAAPLPTLADCDLVFHASGNPAGLEPALHAAGFEGKVVELSWFGDRPVTLPLGGDFHAKRLSLVSSQVGSVATARRARWPHRRRIETALRLLLDDDLDALFTGDTAFADLPRAMGRILADPRTLCHRILYD